MLICIITAMAQKTFPCSIKSWWYINFKISQFFNWQLRDSCLLRTGFCISWFLQIWCTPWTFYLLGHLPNVSIVHLHPFKLIQPMRQATVKNFNIWILASSLCSVYLYDVAGKNINPNLIPKSAFPFKFEGRKRVSWDSRSLLWDAHISAINADEAVVQTDTIFPAFNNNFEEKRCVKFEQSIKKNHYYLPQQAQDWQKHK